MIINDLVPALKAALGEGGSLVPMFKSMADSLAVLLPQLIDAFVPVLIQMAENGDELVYVIVALAHAIRFLMIFVEPVFELLAGIGMVFKGLEEMNPSMIFQGLGKAAGGLALILAPIFRMVEAIAEFLGIIDEEGSDLQRAGSGCAQRSRRWCCCWFCCACGRNCGWSSRRWPRRGWNDHVCRGWYRERGYAGYFR